LICSCICALFLSLAMAGTSAMAGLEARREGGRKDELDHLQTGGQLRCKPLVNLPCKWVVNFPGRGWSTSLQTGGQLGVQSSKGYSDHGKAISSDGSIHDRGRFLLVLGLFACEGEERPYQYVAPLTERDAGLQRAGDLSARSAAGENADAVGATDTGSAERSADPTIQLAGQESSACEAGSTQPCGALTDQGICKFGVRSCSNSSWGRRISR
jgi:hypothetical protein